MTQEILSPNLSMPTFSFKSLETFKKFAGSRSWEPGWLADFRKDCWESFSALPEKIIKDERWRFSPKARFSLDSIHGLADPKSSLIIEKGSSENGISMDLLDRLILDQPHALVELPKLQGPELGAQEYSLLTGAFAETGFLLRVAKSTHSDTPLVIEYREPEAGKIAFHHNMIEIGDHSEVTLIEKFCPHSSGMGGHISNLLKVRPVSYTHLTLPTTPYV